MNARGRVLVFVLLAVSFMPANTVANLVTIELVAQVTAIDDMSNLLESLIDVGDELRGTYLYEASTSDASPLSTVGQYSHYSTPHRIALSCQGLAFQTDPGNVDFLIGILNDNDGRDSYGFASYNNLPLPNGVEVQHISWQLDDYTAMALSSDALPLTAPLLGEWSHPRQLMITLGAWGGSGIGAEVTSVHLVPEPATVFLLALGGIVLLRVRRQP